MASAAATAAEGHGRLVRCLMRTLLRDARRIRHSRAPFLFLQERPRKEAYSHLWELQPGSHDAAVLDAMLPPYLRHELSTCELTGEVRSGRLRVCEMAHSRRTVHRSYSINLAMLTQHVKELERIVKASFRRFQHLGDSSSSSGGSHATAAASSKPTTPTRSGAGGRRRGSGSGGEKERGAAAAAMIPKLDEAVDDLLGLVRLMAEQIRCVSSAAKHAWMLCLHTRRSAHWHHFPHHKPHIKGSSSAPA